MNFFLGKYPDLRLRRLRDHARLRKMVAETELNIHDLILPLFIHEGLTHKKPIAALPGHDQLSLQDLPAEIDDILALNIPGVILFGIPLHKDQLGTASYQSQGVIQNAIRCIKSRAPELLVIADACLCEYTDHGHCGVLSEPQRKKGIAAIDNDATLALLAKQAVSYAEAGADVIAPSGMQDGMVQAIRRGLDAAQYTHIPILSYAVKYASALYAPFREAAEGAPQLGDRKAYQMDYANQAEALREAALDLAEGADLLMVKPAQTYLDVIYRLTTTFPAVPVAAYHVSGEFALIKAAAERGWIDEKKVTLEVLTAIKRAGARILITYYAKEVAHWLGSQ